MTSKTPMKNQMGIPEPCISLYPFLSRVRTKSLANSSESLLLPENYVERREDNGNQPGPYPLVLVERNRIFRGQLGGAINKAFQLRHRPGLGEHAHHEDHDGGEQACPQRAEDIFRHRLGRIRKRYVF